MLLNLQRAWNSGGFVLSSCRPISGRDQLNLLVNAPADQGQEGRQTLQPMGLPPTLRCPRTQPKKVSLGQRLLRTYFSLWTLLNGVPSTQCQSPSLPCFGQADPVGKSACCPVEEPYRKTVGGDEACRSISLGHLHPSPSHSPCKPTDAGLDSILTWLCPLCWPA